MMIAPGCSSLCLTLTAAIEGCRTAIVRYDTMTGGYTTVVERRIHDVVFQSVNGQDDMRCVEGPNVQALISAYHGSTASSFD